MIALKFTYYLSYIISIGFTLIGIPLVLKKIEPNNWYGVRIPKTMSNIECWYTVNYNVGLGLVISGIASIMLIYLIYNNFVSNRIQATVICVLTPILLSLVGMSVGLIF
ncbi:SdpI family protein [Alishewanella sp. HH-ZS]|uniref:SdpI family protein n=1 Tax=Alishewanella sp. HH-ZS TaxID=1856684 RepID=UPI0009F26082